MEDLANLIDATTFGFVRRSLSTARSPITSVMLVRKRDNLASVGAALVAEEHSGADWRRRQWQRWFTSGEVRLAGEGVADFGVNLDGISDSTICDVLYLPPIYVVCLRADEACPHGTK